MPNRQLREQCEAEFENIDSVVAELFLLAKPEKSEYSVAELAAMATFLHNFYNGVENILKRILIATGAELKNSFHLAQRSVADLPCCRDHLERSLQHPFRLPLLQTLLRTRVQLYPAVGRVTAAGIGFGGNADTG
jgi:hypothetical protein